mmetsp:Transcript_27670/g.76117  ORF Transcript_27670/g.76117 Transcript_27670/m.76117 type:complete len:335 (+) Transcript_27670:534-1538(+)
MNLLLAAASSFLAPEGSLLAALLPRLPSLGRSIARRLVHFPALSWLGLAGLLARQLARCCPLARRLACFSLVAYRLALLWLGQFCCRPSLQERGQRWRLRAARTRERRRGRRALGERRRGRTASPPGCRSQQAAQAPGCEAAFDLSQPCGLGLQLQLCVGGRAGRGRLDRLVRGPLARGRPLRAGPGHGVVPDHAPGPEVVGDLAEAERVQAVASDDLCGQAPRSQALPVDEGAVCGTKVSEAKLKPAFDVWLTPQQGVPAGNTLVWHIEWHFVFLIGSLASRELAANQVLDTHLELLRLHVKAHLPFMRLQLNEAIELGVIGARHDACDRMVP